MEISTALDDLKLKWATLEVEMLSNAVRSVFASVDIAATRCQASSYDSPITS